MMQTCHPRCDVPLPEIGNARVMTAFEACQAPPELTIKIIHEVRSTSTFLARDAVVDSRNIGTEHWPLKLNVQFFEQKTDEYYVKACVVTERLNTATCFMNSTYKLEEIAQCGGGPAGAVPISLILLSVLLALLAVFVAIGIVLLIHRMFLRFCDEEGRSRRYHKQSQLSALLPSAHRMEDDRLTVIEEEREDEDEGYKAPFSTLMPSPSDDDYKGSFYTNFGEKSPATTQIVVCDPKPFLHSFRPVPEAV